MLEVVGHTTLSIAEEMSVTLQRTAYSSIVREAMDFSTALFDVKGDLIAQSDNIPTHLGSMGKTLKGILKNHYLIEKIHEGDQIIINQRIWELLIHRICYYLHRFSQREN